MLDPVRSPIIERLRFTQGHLNRYSHAGDVYKAMYNEETDRVCEILADLSRPLDDIARQLVGEWRESQELHRASYQNGKYPKVSPCVQRALNASREVLQDIVLALPDNLKNTLA